ncbi:MAG: hypothetical protein ACRYFS_00100 [Janthinobacterium lividum]
MTASQPRYSREETARRGQEIYERDIRSAVENDHHGKFAAIDIETGVYVMDNDDYSATENLLARQPDAQIWLVHIGYISTYRIGGPRSSASRKAA